MSGATFVHCPKCGRLMLGQRSGDVVFPQPHLCKPTPADVEADQ